MPRTMPQPLAEARARPLFVPAHNVPSLLRKIPQTVSEGRPCRRVWEVQARRPCRRWTPSLATHRLPSRSTSVVVAHWVGSPLSSERTHDVPPSKQTSPRFVGAQIRPSASGTSTPLCTAAPGRRPLKSSTRASKEARRARVRRPRIQIRPPASIRSVWTASFLNAGARSRDVKAPRSRLRWRRPRLATRTSEPSAEIHAAEGSVADRPAIGTSPAGPPSKTPRSVATTRCPVPDAPMPVTCSRGRSTSLAAGSGAWPDQAVRPARVATQRRPSRARWSSVTLSLGRPSAVPKRSKCVPSYRKRPSSVPTKRKPSRSCARLVTAWFRSPWSGP